MISPVQHLRTGRPQADTEEEEDKIILQQSSTIISTTNMQTVSLLFCIMIAVATADDAAAPSCRSRWSNIDGRCFQYVPRLLTWSDAERNCQSMDAHLASVHSMKEYMAIQDYINTLTLSNPEIWLGGTDCQEKNTWLWTDGSDFSGLNWCPGHPEDLVPSQSCLQMNSKETNCWADQFCSFIRPSICAYNL
ncbi:hypothetical protein ABVT39_014270 [Epinephelus coioides]